MKKNSYSMRKNKKVMNKKVSQANMIKKLINSINFGKTFIKISS